MLRDSLCIVTVAALFAWGNYTLSERCHQEDIKWRGGDALFRLGHKWGHTYLDTCTADGRGWRYILTGHWTDEPIPMTAEMHWMLAEDSYLTAEETSNGGLLGLKAINNIGAMLLNQGDLDGAEVAFRRALDGFPYFDDAHVNMGTINHKRARMADDADERLRLLRRAARFYSNALLLRPRHPFALNNLGKLLVEFGDRERGLEMIRQARAINPDLYPELK